jgi:hypothetical protein
MSRTTKPIWRSGPNNRLMSVLLCLRTLYPMRACLSIALAFHLREPRVAAMSEERGNLILELLRAIRGDIADLKTATVEVKERLGFLEVQYASISRRIERIDGRLERIERRLGLIEAEPQS